MARTMGMDFGLNSINPGFKRKYRWLFKIDDISSTGTNALPNLKGARPSLTFKDTEVQHLNESISIPVKPEWKTVNLILYDLERFSHPVSQWINSIYDAQGGNWSAFEDFGFKKKGILELYDGCGCTIETWIFENMYPQSIDFDDLDMGNSEFLTVDLNLKFDRAYML